MHEPISFSLNSGPVIFSSLSELHVQDHLVHTISLDGWEYLVICCQLIHSFCGSVVTTLLQERPRWLVVHGDFCSSTCLPHSLPTLMTGCSVFGNDQNLELQLQPLINKLKKPNKYSCNSIVKNKIPSLFFSYMLPLSFFFLECLVFLQSPNT